MAFQVLIFTTLPRGGKLLIAGGDALVPEAFESWNAGHCRCRCCRWQCQQPHCSVVYGTTVPSVPNSCRSSKAKASLTAVLDVTVNLFLWSDGFLVLFGSYRGSTGEDLKREKESEGEIKQALEQSKRAMRFGDTYGAVSALESVKQVTRLSVGGTNY